MFVKIFTIPCISSNRCSPGHILCCINLTDSSTVSPMFCSLPSASVRHLNKCISHRPQEGRTARQHDYDGATGFRTEGNKSSGCRVAGWGSVVIFSHPHARHGRADKYYYYYHHFCCHVARYANLT